MSAATKHQATLLVHDRLSLRLAGTRRIPRAAWAEVSEAARLVEQMEDQGVVSSANHVGKREILIPEQG